MSEDNTVVADTIPTQEFTPLDPAAVEAEMIRREKESNVSPEDAAATMFTLYFPRFSSQVDMLSSNALRRVLKALVETPLNDIPYNHSSALEKDVLSTGIGLLDAKYVMLFATYSGGLEGLTKVANDIEAGKTEDELASGLTEVLTKIENEGEKNG